MGIDEQSTKGQGEERRRRGPEVEAQVFRSGSDQLAEEQERRRRGVEPRDDEPAPEVEAQRRRR
jgi:hypothetical protein